MKCAWKASLVLLATVGCGTTPTSPWAESQNVTAADAGSDACPFSTTKELASCTSASAQSHCQISIDDVLGTIPRQAGGATSDALSVRVHTLSCLDGDEDGKDWIGVTLAFNESKDPRCSGSRYLDEISNTINLYDDHEPPLTEDLLGTIQASMTWLNFVGYRIWTKSEGGPAFIALRCSFKNGF